jgi:hypothetical protein
MVSRHMTLVGLMVLACMVSTKVQSADLTDSLFACLREATEERDVLRPMEAAGKQAPTTGISLLCNGPGASALFQSMELVSTQELGRDGAIYRRSANGVQCSRLPSPTVWHSCFITIEVDAAFADALH